MAEVLVRDMLPEDEYFVSACSHVSESPETDRHAAKRREWLVARVAEGKLWVKVALQDGQRLGFLYLAPIEHAPTGPAGRGLAVIPCMWVCRKLQKRGAGSALLAAAEREARERHFAGIVTTAHYHDFWFMPAAFFEKHGFVPAARQDTMALMWKPFDASARPPQFLRPEVHLEAIPGKVVIDLYWTPFCLDCLADPDVVQSVMGELGDRVVLREHNTGDTALLAQCGHARAFYVNGVEAEWDHEDAANGVRQAIQAAMAGGK